MGKSEDDVITKFHVVLHSNEFTAISGVIICCDDCGAEHKTDVTNYTWMKLHHDGCSKRVVLEEDQK